MNYSVKGNIVDIRQRMIVAGELSVTDGRITAIDQIANAPLAGLPYLLPGFIDAHVHIESSMLVPSEFARLAVVHGTVSTISDPHEIANVCGMEGIMFMIGNGQSVNFKFNFGAPSCVPATAFETAGAAITSTEIEKLLGRDDIRYLSEMMNFPGVLNDDPEVLKKIRIALAAGKRVDGHAPALTGDPLKKYVASGISTDHECFTEEEAREKLSLGMKILIREGSAAKNFDALIGLLHEYPDDIMFCSDDKHPDSLVHSHINELCRRAVACGIDVFHVLKAACLNPVSHYALDVGTLQAGDPADFILVEDLTAFKVMRTYINGVCVADNGSSLIPQSSAQIINNFSCDEVGASDLTATAAACIIDGKLPVIEALDGQLITHRLMLEPLLRDSAVVPDITRDVLKIAVINRYLQAAPAIAFIKNFGLQQGAIASSVAHDSHNIIAVGADDDSIAAAVNMVISAKGGISCVGAGRSQVLALRVAGLMSTEDGYKVAEGYTQIDAMAKSLGSTLSAPFMTLSFMALLVIPALKLSDKGLFDGNSFRFLLPALPAG